MVENVKPEKVMSTINFILYLFGLVIMIVAMSTVSQSNDFCPPGFAPFHRDHGYALVGHVIATLPLFLPDCMTACEETLTCFSINVYKNQHGGNMCELNKSNKNRSPGSLVRMTGYQYAEPEVKRFCVKNDCPIKEALPDGWFYFNSSYFKMFFDKRTWHDARKYCQDLHGGDLASIASVTEHEYVHKLIVLPTEYVIFRLLITDVEYQKKLLSLLNGAAIITSDGYPSLYLDGIDDYATTNAFPVHRTSLTFGVWIKTPNPERTMTIFSDYEDGLNSAFRFYIQGNKFVCELYTVASTMLRYVSVSSVPANVFVHLAFTFEKTSLTGQIYYNGVLDSETTPSITNRQKKLFESSRSTYTIGQSQTSVGPDKFIGWMRYLTVVGRLLGPEQVNEVKNGTYLEGAWFGLNDIATERRIGWIDGMPLTYQPDGILYNLDRQDCAVIVKSRTNQTLWKMENCYAKAFFVCEKH